MDTLTASESIPKVRGRLRRRERRKNIGQPKKLAVRKLEKKVGDVTETSRYQPKHEYLSPSTTDGERWAFDSGEIGVKDRTNQVPAVLVLDIDPLDLHDSPPPDGSLSQRYFDSDPRHTARKTANLPTIKI